MSKLSEKLLPLVQKIGKLAASISKLIPKKSAKVETPDTASAPIAATAAAAVTPSATVVTPRKKSLPEPAVFKFVLCVGFLAMGVMTFSVVNIVHRLVQMKPSREIASVGHATQHLEAKVSDEAHGSDQEHADGAEEHAGSANEHGGGVLQSPYSEEILSRQDGVPETDHDLKDVVKSKLEVFKEGLKQKEIEIIKPHYFVAITSIMASAKEGNDSSGGVYADVTLDLSTPAAEKEALAQVTQLRSLITAIISEKQRSNLMIASKGIPDLKKDIQKRAQHVIKSGEVQDVLLTQYFFKQ